jgi:microcystin-dependent protein
MEPFIGQVMLFAGNFAPRGWAFCDGTLLPVAQNTALFSILGTIYGGDGRTTFALPDLRGRVAISPGNGAGLDNYSVGQKGGAEKVTLSIEEMPSHSHTGSAQLAGADPITRGTGTNSPKDSVPGVGGVYGTAANTTMKPAAVDNNNTGGDQAHENRQPFLAINYIIALEGVYPPRN